MVAGQDVPEFMTAITVSRSMDRMQLPARSACHMYFKLSISIVAFPMGIRAQRHRLLHNDLCAIQDLEENRCSSTPTCGCIATCWHKFAVV
eukprot:scaffold79788_cov18-Tisochrysis_lutea.AAC.3